MFLYFPFLDAGFQGTYSKGRGSLPHPLFFTFFLGGCFYAGLSCWEDGCMPINLNKNRRNYTYPKMDNIGMKLGLSIAVIVLLGIWGYFALRKPVKVRKMKVELVEKKPINHNTILMTFMLPNFRDRLNLKVGEHLEISQKIRGDLVRRKYTPVSSLDRIGSFDVMVRLYPPTEAYPEGGKMSTFLSELPLHAKIKITLPFGRLNYLGNTVIQVTDQEGVPHRRKFNNIYMVAEGTGITSVYQLIRYMCEQENNSSLPNLTLLFANKTDMNILLENQLKSLCNHNQKLNCHFTVVKSMTKEWAGMLGVIDEEKILNTLPADLSQTMFIGAGSSSLYRSLEGIKGKLEIPAHQIHLF